MNVQKKRVQPVKKVISYGLGEKPDIYMRIDKERERLKNIKNFTRQSELKIIYKYWTFLKRHYLFQRMVKIQKMKLLSDAFKLLKINYLINYQKFGEIVEKFDLRKKRKIFYMIYNEYIIKSKKRFLIKQRLISSYNNFLYNIRGQKEQQYKINSLTQRFYFNIFINKVLNLSLENNRIMQCTTLITNYQMKNAYFSFFRFLKRKNYITNELYILPRTHSYIYFFQTIKEKINKKYENIKKLYDFRLKFAYKNCCKQIKLIIKERNKIYFSNQFYEEKLQRKVFSKIKEHYIVINTFRTLVINKYLYEKERVKEKACLDEYKKQAFIKKYREYKEKKLVPIKSQFFKNTKTIIEHKKKNNYAREYWDKALRKKIFIELGKYTVKNKLFKIFLIKFQKIYKYNIKKDYINLMQYKVHKYLNQNEQKENSLPHAVAFYIMQKFNNQTINVKIFEMVSFIKKCKKMIINKKKEKNNNLVASIFYSKLLKIKVFDNLNSYHKYIQIKKLYKKNVIKLFLNKLKTSLILFKKERTIRENERKRKGKSIYQKFFIGLIINEGVNIYNHRKTSIRNIIINQILKNEEINNDTKNMIDVYGKNSKIKSINYKLATIIIFKLLLFIIYRQLFNKLKSKLLSYKFRNYLLKKYIWRLNQAKINQNIIKSKMDRIKDDVLNINK